MTNHLPAGTIILWTLVSCAAPRQLADGGTAPAAAACETFSWWKTPGEMLAYPASMPEGPSIATAEAQVNLVVAAVHDYCQRRGEWPGGIPDLLEAGRAVPPGTRCTLRELPADPWGTPYRYGNRGATFDLSSAGPDRVFGSADDIVRAPMAHPRSERFAVRDLCRAPGDPSAVQGDRS